MPGRDCSLIQSARKSILSEETAHPSSSGKLRNMICYVFLFFIVSITFFSTGIYTCPAFLFRFCRLSSVYRSVVASFSEKTTKNTSNVTMIPELSHPFPRDLTTLWSALKLSQGSSVHLNLWIPERFPGECIGTWVSMVAVSSFQTAGNHTFR